MMSSTMRLGLNPDEDFVLHGRTASYWEKPVYLSNSKLTNTTSRLSQHSLFDPDNYKERHHVSSLGDLASNLQDLSLRFKHKLDKSVSFGDRSRLSTKDSNLSFGGRSYSQIESDWYNPRVSRYRSDSHVRSSLDFERPQSARFTSHTGLGEEEYSPRERIEYPLSTADSLSLHYFPVTMSAPYELTYIDSDSSSNKHSIRPKSAALRSQRSILKDRSSVDKEYYMTSEAPTTGAAPAFITSPYQCELARLRMERLRIEEDRLVELKRYQEMERIRGPKVKWYESKGPDFHYESHKNTEKLKNEQHWEDLMKYRDSLQRSSLDLRKSYPSIA